jgi:hypothetical protein
VVATPLMPHAVERRATATATATIEQDTRRVAAPQPTFYNHSKGGASMGPGMQRVCRHLHAYSMSG